MGVYYITIQPSGKRVRCQKNLSLLAALQREKLDIETVCGGKGICGHCKVRLTGIENLPVSEKDRYFFSPGELQAGYRLACGLFLDADAALEILKESLRHKQRLQLSGHERDIKADPLTKKFLLRLPAATLSDSRDDARRVVEALSALTKPENKENLHFDWKTLSRVPTRLRSSDWLCTATLRRSEIIGIEEGDTVSKKLGIAFDVGTTKIAAYLVDLETGKTLDVAGLMNPQLIYGDDIISRVAFAMEKTKNATTLNRLLTRALNTLIDELCQQNGLAREKIVEISVAGNTVMQHFLANTPLNYLVSSPYIPVTTSSIEIKARELCIGIAPGGYISILPAIAGFVGGDHVAMILATGLENCDKIKLGIDIGTNTEVVLAKDGNLSVCSCASGPAFEGMNISWGMRAADGAIERVEIDADDLKVNMAVIGDVAPIGICGSGIVDIVAQLLKNGILDQMGDLRISHGAVRRGRENSQLEFVVAEGKKTATSQDIVVTQGDIRQIQMAKAAISSAINILLHMNNVKVREIDEFVIAGAFGCYLNIESARDIGLLPQMPLNRFKMAGNAAGAGAKLFLLSQEMRKKADMVSRTARYVELASYPRYNSLLVSATSFPDASHTEKIKQTD